MMSALPSQRWPEPVHASPATAEQIAERAAEVLAYYTDSDQSHAMFCEALGELADNDATAEQLYILHEAGDTAELGAQVSRMVREALAAKAAQYAEDELNGDLGPRDAHVPQGYISHKAAMAKARAHADRYRAMVARVSGHV